MSIDASPITGSFKMTEIVDSGEGRVDATLVSPDTLDTTNTSIDAHQPSREDRKESEGSTASTAVPDRQDVKSSEGDVSSVPPLPDKSTHRTLRSANNPSRPIMPPKAATEAAKDAPRASMPTLSRSTTSREPPPRRTGSGFPYRFDEEDDASSSSSEEEWTTRPKENKSAHLAGQTSEEINKRRRRKPSESRNGVYSKFSIGNEAFRTKGRVRKRDGRLNISVNELANTDYLAQTLSAGLKRHLLPSHGEDADEVSAERKAEKASVKTREIIEDDSQRPRLNIVIMVIGSRGDIQPFIKIAKVLQNEYGHRVRMATHPAFKDFVQKDSGLEFFSVGGNPSELMAFMVKNPGLIPSIETVRAGEIGRRRQSMYEMFQGMWRACINATDDETDKTNIAMMGAKQPFVADAIIANPPSFAHVHIAERLGVPLHMMFTFPYSPTTSFPHPLANIKQSNVDYDYSNFMSYPLVELMTWQGLGDLVNKFRVKTLGLEPVSTLWAPGQLYRLKVPYTYLWSPSLVPKPKDWGPEIDIGGFVFLELASSFEPPEDLVKFLDAGDPPVYIGFGSIVVDDPNKFTSLIFEAVKLAGVRALVSKGWGELGGDSLDVPDNVFMLNNTPHDWLFPKVSAVVHHGGAGTTAIGLKCGRPTMIVPFFGDQPFWGEMVANARAGAFKCIPYKKLTAEKLANGIKECLTDEATRNVKRIAESIEAEGDGAVNAVKSFHRSLRLKGNKSMTCSILENRVAVWQLKNTSLRLSALAAEILVEKGKISWKDLNLFRCYDWNDFEGPGEPFTGAGMAIYRTLVGAGKGISMVPVRATRVVRHRVHHVEKKRKHEARRKKLAKANENIEKSCPDEVSIIPGQDDKQKEAEELRPTSSRSDAPAAPKRRGTGFTDLSTLSPEPSENLITELAEETGYGLAKTGEALYHAPLDLTLALAQGFHNAPRIYGDETVRTPPRIDGIASGFRAGRDEFAYGIYDGFTGLVRLPAKGAKENGVLGCLEGFGMGIGGLVLKNIAASFGLVAFPAMGVRKRIQRGRQPIGFIRKARMRQGVKEFDVLKERDRVEKYQENTNRAMTASFERRSMEGPRILQETETGKEGRSVDEPKNIEMVHDGKRKQQGEQDDTTEDNGPFRTQMNDPSLETIEHEVEHGWQIVLEVLDATTKKRSQGFFSRLALKHEKRKWRDAQVLESIGTAKKAKKAKKEGKDVGKELKKQREDVDAANAPRLPAMEGTSKVEMNGSVDGRPRGQTEGAVAKVGRDRGNTEVADFAVAGRAR